MTPAPANRDALARQAHAEQAAAELDDPFPDEFPMDDAGVIAICAARVEARSRGEFPPTELQAYRLVCKQAAQLAAIRAERERLRMLGAIVLAAADADIGIARLSDDGLAWECPKCAAPGSCEPGCTRNALLIALDVLSEAIRPAPAVAERSGETPHTETTKET